MYSVLPIFLLWYKKIYFALSAFVFSPTLALSVYYHILHLPSSSFPSFSPLFPPSCSIFFLLPTHIFSSTLHLLPSIPPTSTSELEPCLPSEMFTRLTSHVNRDSARYQLCDVDKTVGSCLTDSQCKREDGLFAGYCGDSDGVCCIGKDGSNTGRLTVLPNDSCV